MLLSPNLCPLAEQVWNRHCQCESHCCLPTQWRHTGIWHCALCHWPHWLHSLWLELADMVASAPLSFSLPARHHLEPWPFKLPLVVHPSKSSTCALTKTFNRSAKHSLAFPFFTFNKKRSAFRHKIFPPKSFSASHAHFLSRFSIQSLHTNYCKQKHLLVKITLIDCKCFCVITVNFTNKNDFIIILFFFLRLLSSVSSNTSTSFSVQGFFSGSR